MILQRRKFLNGSRILSNRCLEINRVLMSFSRYENMQLFKSISQNYSFYSKMVENDKNEYFFKLTSPHGKILNRPFDIDEVMISVFSKKKYMTEIGEVEADGYEIVNYVQGEADRQSWFGTIKSVLRDKKLEEILK